MALDALASVGLEASPGPLLAEAGPLAGGGDGLTVTAAVVYKTSTMIYLYISVKLC